MTVWQATTLGAVCELKRGYDLPARDRVDGDVPIVSSSGITGYHSTAKVAGPGVVTGRYGTLGQVFFIGQDFWPLNTALYVRDFKGNDPHFVAALLRSLDLGKNDGAAAVPGVNRNQLHLLPVRCPDTQTQRRVGLVLSALDDVIDNNCQRIGLLEQMAQAIYREWFVCFRYPGHENHSLIQSPIGPIPAGWMVRPLVSVANLTMGQSPSSEHYNSDRIGKPFHQGVTDFGRHFPTNRKYCSVESRSALDGDLLVSVRAPVGRLNIACDDLTIGRGLAAVRSVTNRQALLFRTLKDVVFAEEDSMGGGTIFKAIGKTELQQVQVVCAPDDLEDRAETVFRDNLALIRALDFANRSLVALRDLLLPRLVTGQIDVSKLDLDTLVESVA